MVTAEHREQLRRAGQVSARVRSERRATREWLRDTADTWESRDRLAELLVGAPLAHLATLRTIELLTWSRWIGPERGRQLMRRAGIQENRLVGALTRRQSLALAGELRQGTDDLALAVA